VVSKVWILWDDGDYYGPDLQGIYSTEEAAKEAHEKLEGGKYGFIGYVEEYELDYEV
jgi:hypothetical protein